jgi:hypothetical protein
MSEFLTEDITKQVIDFSINTGHTVDPTSFFDEKGNVKVPKGADKAYLIFILESRRLAKIELESVYDPELDIVYGGFKKVAGAKKDDKKELRRYPINSVTTEINLKSPEGIEFFQMCCASRFVAGTKNAFAKPYFRIEIPELTAQKELEKYDSLDEAIGWIAKLKEEEMDDLAIILGILGFSSQTPAQKKTILRKYSLNNPAKVVEAKNNKDSKMLVMFHKALANQVIKNVKGVYRWADYGLGTTNEQCISFFEQNNELYEMILVDLNNKLKKK